MKDKIKKLNEVVKEIINLIATLEELIIRIISLAGWIIILIIIIKK